VKPVIEIGGGPEGNDNNEVKFLPKANVVENGAVLPNPEVITSTKPLVFWEEPAPLKGFIEVKAPYFNTQRINKAALDSQAKQKRAEYQVLMKPDQKAINAYLKKNRKKFGVIESLYKSWTHEKKYTCNTPLRLKVNTAKSTLQEAFNNAISVVFEADYTPQIQSFPIFKSTNRSKRLEFTWVVPHPTMPEIPLKNEQVVVLYETNLVIKKSLVGKDTLQAKVMCKVKYRNPEGKFVPVESENDRYILPEKTSKMLTDVQTYFEATNDGYGQNNE
jgi:hypothetical protein